MKKTLRKIIAVVLCICLLGTTGIFTSFAADTDASGNDYSSVQDFVSSSTKENNLLALKKLFTKIINLISNLLINGIIGRLLNLAMPSSNTIQDYDSFDLESYEGFYPGMDEFLDEPAEEAKWSVGYASASIMPADFNEKEYAKGAYLPYVYGNDMYADDEGVKEELRVRTVIMNDGSGRGNVVFCAVDCMGLANADVRKVRAALADFSEENNIVSINVDATHIHTGIDSQGVWTDPVGTMITNSTSEETVTAVDPTFLQAIIDGCVESATEAYADMKEGSLYYAKTDIGEYLRDRTAPIEYDEYMYRLEFLPDDASADPTMICTFGCHPESSSYDWKYTDENGKTQYDKLFSADFVWYMEKIANLAGYNFIYLQGNVSTTTSSRGLSSDSLENNAHDSAIRYGFEMGYICMTMTMTESERIAFNKKTGDRLSVEQNKGKDSYTVWYDGLATETAEEVEPLLNIAHEQFFIKIENNVVGTLGKTGMADNLILRKNAFTYYTVSEVGYMEVGEAFKVYISPGETFTEILKGGNGLDGFDYPAIRDYVGEDTIIMDLCNDAAGYVANPANYTLVGLQYNEESGKFDGDTWCLISFGYHEADTFIAHFYNLVDSCR